jgi:hypothetical protein
MLVIIFLKIWQKLKNMRGILNKMSAILLLLKQNLIAIHLNVHSWPTLEMKDRYPGRNVSSDIRF